MGSIPVGGATSGLRWYLQAAFRYTKKSAPLEKTSESGRDLLVILSVLRGGHVIPFLEKLDKIVHVKNSAFLGNCLDRLVGMGENERCRLVECASCGNGDPIRDAPVLREVDAVVKIDGRAAVSGDEQDLLSDPKPS